VTGLRALVTTIMEREELDKLKRDSFIYYLKKDFDYAHPGSDDAGSYSRKALVQPNFCTLMDGLWALDNFRFEVHSPPHLSQRFGPHNRPLGSYNALGRARCYTHQSSQDTFRPHPSCWPYPGSTTCNHFRSSDADKAEHRRLNKRLLHRSQSYLY